MLSSVNSVDSSSRSTAAASVGQSRTMQAAQEFEALLIGSLLEQMQQSMSLDKSEGDAGKQEMNELCLQAVAKSMAENGGIGIARMLARSVDNSKPSAL